MLEELTLGKTIESAIVTEELGAKFRSLQDDWP